MHVRPALILLALAGAFAPAADKPAPNPLAEPRQRLLRGNFDEARAGFEAAAKAHPDLAPAAVAGIGRAFREVGEYDKALAALAAALKAHPENHDLLAARADLFFNLGRWEEAERDADAALKANDDHLLARWTKARLLRDRGDEAAADAAIRWVVRYYSARDDADKPITDPDELLIVAEAGAENARRHNLTKQFSFILNEVLADALKAEPNLWAGEVLAGTMLLEKYNRPDALDAFDKAVKINPKSADALAGKARAALQKYEMKEADRAADQALRANPRHPAALRAKAEVSLAAGDIADAERRLDRAAAVNPRDEITLGRLAAVYLEQHRQAEFDRLAEAVAKFDAKPGVFYYELAEGLESRKRYTPAAAFYRKAADLRPILAGPRTGLGLLHLRLGQEAEGRPLLAKAFDLDPFNVRVANSLRVLKHLDKYKTITTPHYELRFNPETDTILAGFMAEYLEETHAELKRQFGYEPPGRVLIEVFSTHEMFSGRMVGLPDLHTVGASTGRLVAMASPTAKGLRKAFNWGRVVRHELTHVFNLCQTDFLCPHWLTEGLATRNENMGRPPSWVKILRDRLDADDLLDLDTVMFGFIRPRTPDEWHLAYFQSLLYVEYLVKTHGEGCVGKILDAYRDGQGTAGALRACGIEKAAFEKGYRAYVEEVVKPYRTAAKKREEKPLTFAELEEAHTKHPDDADLSARLADQLFKRNKFADSKKLANAALEAKPGHPLASAVKARLLSRAEDEDGAAAALEAGLAANPDDPRLLLAVGKARQEAKDPAGAAKAFEHGRKIAPLDGDWLEPLAKLYRELKDTEKLAGVLAEVASHDPDDLAGRVTLAELALDAKKPADAEGYARDALRIDVGSKEARAALLAALRAQKKDAEAEAMEKRFGS